MRSPKPTLLETLQVLMASPSRDKVILSGGLTLIYVPGAENNGIYQLKLGRNRQWPSKTEVAVMRRELQTALRKMNRPFGNMITEPYLKSTDNVWWYHNLEWRQYQQTTLLDHVRQAKEALRD